MSKKLRNQMNEYFNLLNKMHEGVIVLNLSANNQKDASREIQNQTSKSCNRILFETDIAREIPNNNPSIQFTKNQRKD